VLIAGRSGAERDLRALPNVWHFRVPTALPPSILVPWRALSQRLGRRRPEAPFQSFYDLFLANYRYAEHAQPGAPLSIENLAVLVPAFGNEAERVFYMSFVEMHHHFTPVVGAVCDLDDAVRERDTERVLGALGRIGDSFRRATRCESLHRHDLGLLARLFELAAQALDGAIERPGSGPCLDGYASDLATAMRREILANARARHETPACRAAPDAGRA
jgi:hypothetical protein